MPPSVRFVGPHSYYFFLYPESTKSRFTHPLFSVLAAPKPSVQKDLLWGRVWVDEKDFSILKIEWNQEMMERTEIIKDMAKRYKGNPQITQIIEFGFEKNGIRFPSRYYIEEAYVNKKGVKNIFSETEVIYKDYKYFTVETEIIIRLP